MADGVQHRLTVSVWRQHFKGDDWWKLPMALRRRWWRATNYGQPDRKEPPAELLEEIRQVLATKR